MAKIFILGLIFGIVILPILDSLTSLILSFLETIKSYLGIKIAKNNQKMQNFSFDDSPQRAIGFVIDEEEEDDL